MDLKPLKTPSFGVWVPNVWALYLISVRFRILGLLSIDKMGPKTLYQLSEILKPEHQQYLEWKMLYAARYTTHHIVGIWIALINMYLEKEQNGSDFFHLAQNRNSNGRVRIV